MKKKSDKKVLRPAQAQNRQPGLQTKMRPQPQSEKPAYQGGDKLKNKVVLITGGDSGIGRAAAIACAKEGADLVILYLNEHADAKESRRQVESEGRRCLLISGDVGNERFCIKAVQRAMKEFGRLDVLINNAAVQFPQKDLQKITARQLEKTFRANIFSYFFMTKAVLPHLKKGSAIINTTSVTAYRGSEHLLDYSSTKGAIVAFTRSLALNLAPRKIRVNGVAPGPIWTPLIPSTMPPEKVSKFGVDTPLQRPGQPAEVAPVYVFLASDQASYVTSAVYAVTGGTPML